MQDVGLERDPLVTSILKTAVWQKDSVIDPGLIREIVIILHYFLTLLEDRLYNLITFACLMIAHVKVVITYRKHSDNVAAIFQKDDKCPVSNVSWFVSVLKPATILTKFLST